MAWLNVVYSTCGNRSPHHSPPHWGVPRLFKCFRHILDRWRQYWSITWSPCGLRCRPLWLLVEWSVQLWHVSVQVDWGPKYISKFFSPPPKYITLFTGLLLKGSWILPLARITEIWSFVPVWNGTIHPNTHSLAITRWCKKTQEQFGSLSWHKQEPLWTVGRCFETSLEENLTKTPSSGKGWWTLKGSSLWNSFFFISGDCLSQNESGQCINFHI